MSLFPSGSRRYATNTPFGRSAGELPIAEPPCARALTADQLSRYNRDLVNLDARGRFHVKRVLRNDEVVRETYTLLELTPAGDD